MLIKIPILVDVLSISRPTAYSLMEYIKKNPEGVKEIEKILEQLLYKKYVDYKKSLKINDKTKDKIKDNGVIKKSKN
jgi:hypothetical protein